MLTRPKPIVIIAALWFSLASILLAQVGKVEQNTTTGEIITDPAKPVTFRSSPGMTATAKAAAGVAKVVYISVRTDSKTGSGTESDPYDGSTATKLDALFPAGSTNTVWQLGEGTFETNGVTVDANQTATLTSGVLLKTGSRLRGQGQERTTLKLKAGAMPSGTYTGTGSSYMRRDMVLSYSEGAGNQVSGLTLDGNRDNQTAYTGNSAYSRIYAVNLAGLDCSVRDVTVRNIWSTSTGGELFPVAISSYAGTWARPATGYIERVTYETSPGFSTALNLLAPSSAVTVSAIGTNDTVSATAHGMVDGTTVYFPSLTGGTGLTARQRYFVRDSATNTFKVALVPGGTAVDVTVAYSAATCYQQPWITGTMRDNVVYGRQEGAYSETQGFGCGGWKDVIVESNRTIGTWSQVLIDTHFYSGVVIRNNSFEGRADPAGQANLGVFVANYGTDGLRVENNTFLLSRNSAAVYIGGNVAGAVITGNTIKKDASTGGSFSQTGIRISGTGNTNIKVTGNRIETGVSMAAFPSSFGADLVWATDNKSLTGGDLALPEKYVEQFGAATLGDLAVPQGAGSVIGGLTVSSDGFVNIAYPGSPFGFFFSGEEYAMAFDDRGTSAGTPTNELSLWRYGARLNSQILITNAQGNLQAPLTYTGSQSIRRNSGNTAWEAFTPGSGSVTSVALSLGGGLFTVSGSPVTTTGTLTGTLATQTANRVFAGPATGSAAAPTFRALVLGDLPALSVGDLTDSSELASRSSANDFLGTQTIVYGSGIFQLQRSDSSLAILAPGNGVSSDQTFAMPGLGGTLVTLEGANVFTDTGNTFSERITLANAVSGFDTRIVSNDGIHGLTTITLPTSTGTLALLADLATYQPLEASLTALAAGSDFVQFSGPASTIKTFILPNASSTLLYSGGALGTPAAGSVLTNATGLPISTGVSGLGSGVATFLATPSSANLRGAITDETGTGVAVFNDTPTLIAPILGTITSGVGTALTALNASNLATGTVGTARLGSGTANSSSFLRGDSTWTAVTVPTIASTSSVLKGDGAGNAVAATAGTDFLAVSGSAAQTITLAPAANTVSTGVLLTDTTTASSGNQQYSPATRWTGQGWKTTATAASQAVDFRAYVVPVQGTTAPTSTWTLDAGINGGAFANAMTVSNTGDLTLPTGTTIAGGTSNPARIQLTASFGVATGITFLVHNSGSSAFGFYLQGAGNVVGTTRSTGLWGWSSGSTAGDPDTSLGRVSARITGFYGTDTSQVGDAKMGHLLAGGTAPTVAAGAGAGTTPTVTMTSGSQDMAGQVSVVTGTVPTGSATVCTITVNRAYPTGTWPVISAANANAAGLSALTAVYAAGASTTTWTISVGATGLTGSTTYLWNYHLGGY